MRQPYLIQRAEIVRPLTPKDGAPLSKTLDYDYMGSSEFEFGALPKSLKALRKADQEGGLYLRRLPNIRSGEAQLRVVSGLSDEDFPQYEEYLLKLRQGAIQTKERTMFSETYQRSEWEKTDFWWDIENHVMWSFDKLYMNRLLGYLQQSFLVLPQ